LLLAANADMISGEVMIMASIGAGFEEVAKLIRAMDEEFMANVKSGDATRLVEAFYADSARVLPPNQPVVSGKSAILELWKGVLESGLTEVVLNTAHVETSGDLAYGLGNYLMTLQQSGDVPRQDEGKYVVVYRRQLKGEWKAIVDMFSSNKSAG
jgi:ketosteroid isomerase-like protein